jgi:hypothetical protein
MYCEKLLFQRPELKYYSMMLGFSFWQITIIQRHNGPFREALEAHKIVTHQIHMGVPTNMETKVYMIL